MALNLNVATDVTRILTDAGWSMTKRRQTETVDSMGRESAARSTINTVITGYISFNVEVDEEQLPLGFVPKTDLVGLFKASDTVQENDMIVDGSNVYTVVAVFANSPISGSNSATYCHLRKVFQ